MRSPSPDEPVPEDPRPDVPAADRAVSVRVVRSGGIAGMRREWHADPPAEETPRWIALIEDCPWEAVVDCSALGGDRFVWRIDAQCGPEEHGAELPDSEVQGPWRDLVDAVREAAPVEAQRGHRRRPEPQ